MTAATYTGGDGDLVRWTLAVDTGMEQINVFGARTPSLVQVRAPEATLTLQAVSKDESVAVIALINEMRAAAQGVVLMPLRAPSIGDRFSGLEL